VSNCFGPEIIFFRKHVSTHTRLAGSRMVTGWRDFLPPSGVVPLSCVFGVVTVASGDHPGSWWDGLWMFDRHFRTAIHYGLTVDPPNLCPKYPNVRITLVRTLRILRTHFYKDLA
jgi:hypothetical protein